LELAGTEIVPADEDFIGQREDYHSPFMHGIYGRGLSQGLVGSFAALPSTRHNRVELEPSFWLLRTF
jgi:hypothetical protein